MAVSYFRCFFYCPPAQYPLPQHGSSLRPHIHVLHVCLLSLSTVPVHTGNTNLSLEVGHPAS
jgi:hypothetical protein